MCIVVNYITAARFWGRDTLASLHVYGCYGASVFGKCAVAPFDLVCIAGRCLFFFLGWPVIVVSDCSALGHVLVFVFLSSAGVVGMSEV